MQDITRLIWQNFDVIFRNVDLYYSTDKYGIQLNFPTISEQNLAWAWRHWRVTDVKYSSESHVGPCWTFHRRVTKNTDKEMAGEKKVQHEMYFFRGSIVGKYYIIRYLDLSVI